MTYSTELKGTVNKKKSEDTRNFNYEKKVKVKSSTDKKSKLKNNKFYGYTNTKKY